METNQRVDTIMNEEQHNQYLETEFKPLNDQRSGKSKPVLRVERRPMIDKVYFFELIVKRSLDEESLQGDHRRRHRRREQM